MQEGSGVLAAGENDPFCQRIAAVEFRPEFPGYRDDHRAFHGKAQPPDPVGQRCCPFEQVSGGGKAAVENAAHGSARAGVVKCLDADTGLAKPRERKVDPVEARTVRLAVLQVIEHLKGVAEIVRSNVGGNGFAMEVDEITPHGGRRAVAVVQEVVPGFVAQRSRVLAKGVQKIERVARRHAGFTEAAGEGER